MGRLARILAAFATAVVPLDGLGLADAGLHAEPPAPHSGLPGPEEVIASEVDLWGEAALRQPGGPTYEFFADLLPPLRYVDAAFRHYPIVLSAPGSPAKARLVSNGGAINALARQPDWRNEAGIPRSSTSAGTANPSARTWPASTGRATSMAISRSSDSATKNDGLPYGQEVFAAVDGALAAAGTALVRFDFPDQDQGRGRIDLRFEHGVEPLTARDGTIRDGAGKVLAAYDDNWEWRPARNLLFSKVEHAPTACVTIFTLPIDADSAPRRVWTSTAGSVSCASADRAPWWLRAPTWKSPSRTSTTPGGR